ncbi:replication initiator protein [Microviridae sp.]|nr:replication initiator protein [Microviridae sp.]
MPCYYPLEGYRSKEPNENGKYPIVFGNQGAQTDDPVRLPCGKCIGCRLETSRQWAIRCHHESQLHDENCFITLTYDEENLPEDFSISKKVWQNFMYKLRDRIKPIKIRFFMCGEYGEKVTPEGVKIFGRPHYHAIIFGYDFKDKELYNVSNGNNIYTSKLLEQIWGNGFVTIADCNMKTAAYTARYIMKKITGDEAMDHYQLLDEETGQVFLREPEFTLQSRRPGIAADWYTKYKSDLKKGFITIDGIKMSFPKYYEKLIEREEDESLYDDLTERKRQSLDYYDPENGMDRLRTKENVKLIRTKTLKRELDNEN